MALGLVGKEKAIPLYSKDPEVREGDEGPSRTGRTWGGWGKGTQSCSHCYCLGFSPHS